LYLGGCVRETGGSSKAAGSKENGGGAFGIPQDRAAPEGSKVNYPKKVLKGTKEKTP